MGMVAIVDDSPDLLEMFELMLRDHHQFLTFSNGSEFLREFYPGKFDLILLDLSMPGVDGFEVFRRIHSADERLPVVAITARSADRQRALAMGFCDYFLKPILEIERFRQTVYSHIGGCANPPYDPSKSEPAA